MGGKAYAGEIGAEVEKIENDLEVEMRRPAAIFVWMANGGEGLSGGDELAGLESGEGGGGEVAVEGEEVVGGGAGCRVGLGGKKEGFVARTRRDGAEFLTSFGMTGK